MGITKEKKIQNEIILTQQIISQVTGIVLIKINFPIIFFNAIS